MRPIPVMQLLRDVKKRIVRISRIPGIFPFVNRMKMRCYCTKNILRHSCTNNTIFPSDISHVFFVPGIWNPAEGLRREGPRQDSGCHGKGEKEDVSPHLQPGGGYAADDFPHGRGRSATERKATVFIIAMERPVCSAGFISTAMDRRMTRAPQRSRVRTGAMRGSRVQAGTVKKRAPPIGMCVPGRKGRAASFCSSTCQTASPPPPLQP